MKIGKKIFVEPRFRDQVEKLFQEMIYAPTMEPFVNRLEAFKQRVRKTAPAFASYFDHNGQHAVVRGQITTGVVVAQLEILLPTP